MPGHADVGDGAAARHQDRRAARRRAGEALHQARDARLKILDVMAGGDLGPGRGGRRTPRRSCRFEIPVDQIGEVIGPKGKVINAIQQETGADIAVDDDGTSAWSPSVPRTARGRRRSPPPDLADLGPADAEVGAVYTGKVVNITKFGAFVNILPGRDGLLHISKVGEGKRVERVEDVVTWDRTSRSRSTRSTRRARSRCRWPVSPRPHTAGTRPAKAARARQRGRQAQGGRAAAEGARRRRAGGADAVVASFEDAFESRAASRPSAISVRPIWPRRHRPAAHGAHRCRRRGTALLRRRIGCSPASSEEWRALS